MSDTPADLRYTADHEWVRRTGQDTVRVGITDFAQVRKKMGSPLKLEGRERETNKNI